MVSNRFIAGILAGLPLSAICVLYIMLRRKVIIDHFKSGDPAMAQISDGLLFMLVLGMFGLVGPFLGWLAGWVYGWVPSLKAYYAVAGGMALLLKVAAVASRTPLALEKIVLNFAVAILLGLVMPGLLKG